MADHGERIYRVFVSKGNVGDEVVLRKEDVHHLRRVLRLENNALVEGFDGRGHRYSGRLVHLPSQGAGLHIDRVEVAEEPSVSRLNLALALVKPEWMELVVQKATELGCSSIQPLVSRFVSRKDALAFIRGRLPRWQRIALESLKQCQRHHQMSLLPPLHALDFFSDDHPGQKLIFHPSAQHSLHQVMDEMPGCPEEVWLAIGPEGGWSQDEYDIAVSMGYRPARTGLAILRSETAAISSLAILASRYNWQPDQSRPVRSPQNPTADDRDK